MWNFSLTRCAAVLAALLAGCAARAPAAGAKDPPGAHDTAHVHGHGHGALDVRRAALPFRVLRGHGGAELSEADFFAELAGADAVCLGEHHPNPHDHWVQLMVIEHLAAAARDGQRALGVGFEMFARPLQGVLDDFGAGKIDEAALLARTGWSERWGYDFALYRPLLQVAVAGHHALLALNAPRELAHKVGESGLGALSASEKQALPDLVLDDDEHRAWFKTATSGHQEPAGESFENFYAAQVVWDETMADSAARWLAAGAAGAPRRQIAIVAGVGHCFEAAIPRRLRRRGVGKALSLQTVIDDGGSAVADVLVAPENDYVIVLDASGAAAH